MKFMTWFFLPVLAFSWTQHYAKKAPLVFAPECDRLRNHLAETAVGNRLLLMTDFSHTLQDINKIRDNLRFILQLSLWMSHSCGKPVVQVDSTYTQHLSDENKLKYNSGHDQVVQSLNLVRGFLQGGIGDLSHYQEWTMVENKAFLKHASQVQKSIQFLHAFPPYPSLRMDNYHVGHEACVAPYESQMTRNDSLSGKLYSCSSHFLWVEDLSNLPIVEKMENPIGLVATDHTHPDQVLQAIQKLNPSHQPGKITLLVRMNRVKSNLPPFVDLLHKHQFPVVWCCDPKKPHHLHQFLSQPGIHSGGLFLHSSKKLDALEMVQQFVSWKQKNEPSAFMPWNNFSL